MHRLLAGTNLRLLFLLSRQRQVDEGGHAGAGGQQVDKHVRSGEHHISNGRAWHDHGKLSSSLDNNIIWESLVPLEIFRSVTLPIQTIFEYCSQKKHPSKKKKNERVEISNTARSLLDSTQSVGDFLGDGGQGT